MCDIRIRVRAAGCFPSSSACTSSLGEGSGACSFMKIEDASARFCKVLDPAPRFVIKDEWADRREQFFQRLIVKCECVFRGKRTQKICQFLNRHRRGRHASSRVGRRLRRGMSSLPGGLTRIHLRSGGEDAHTSLEPRAAAIVLRPIWSPPFGVPRHPGSSRRHHLRTTRLFFHRLFPTYRSWPRRRPSDR